MNENGTVIVKRYQKKKIFNTAQWLIVCWRLCFLEPLWGTSFPILYCRPSKPPYLGPSQYQSFAYIIISIYVIFMTRTSLQTINFVRRCDDHLKLTPNWSVPIFWQRNPSPHELCMSHFKTFWLVPIHFFAAKQTTISLQI